MGENYYQAENRSISFSESADIGCLCTFPHNDTSGGKFEPDAGRIMNLALLGCAVALLHNSSKLQGEGEHILIPQSLGKYGDAIMSWFNSIDAEILKVDNGYIALQQRDYDTIKAMREALQEARVELEYFQAGCDPSSTTDTVVAKIDTSLKGGK